MKSVTILESMLVTGEGESTFQFKTKGALLLSQKKEDFDFYLKYLSTLYRLRSRIVHGSIKEYKNALNKFSIAAKEALIDAVEWSL